MPDSDLYGTHDFRRGHAKVGTRNMSPHVLFASPQDLQQSGATMAKIGHELGHRPKTNSVFRYVDESEFEADTALEAALGGDYYVDAD